MTGAKTALRSRLFPWPVHYTQRRMAQVAKVIDGIYRQGKISGLHTNRDEVILYHVTFIGTEIYQELSLAEALHANQFYQFRLSQGEIEEIFQVRPAAKPQLVEFII